MELDELGGAILSNEPESVHTEPIDVTERTRDTVTGHGPEQGVKSRGLLAKEIPGGVMGCGGLRDFTIALGLDGVDQVGELDGILDEKDGNVVTDDIKVALVSVKAGGETVDIAGEVRTATTAGDGREPDEDGGLLALSGEEGGGGDVGEVAVRGEDTVGTCTPSMDGTLGDLHSQHATFQPTIGDSSGTHPLVVESLDLLTEDKVFQQGRSARTGLETLLVLNWAADVGRQVRVRVVEVVFGQKLLSGLGSIEVGIATAELACHIRTDGIGDADKADQAESSHGVKSR